MTAEQKELALPPPAAWTPPRGRYTCGRDPEAGAGTCWFWWEGCPKAEKRGCYQLWWHEQRKAKP